MLDFNNIIDFTLSSVALLIVGSFIFRAYPWIHVICTVLAFSVFAWDLGYGMAYQSAGVEDATNLVVGVLIISPFYFILGFTLALIGKRLGKKKLLDAILDVVWMM